MSLTLHAVVVKKPKTLEEAREIAKHFIKNKKYHRETKASYRFRNFPKNQFEPGSYKSQKLNEHTTLIFGKHKQDKGAIIKGGGLWDDMIDKIGSFLLKYNPLTVGVKSAIAQGQANRMAKYGSR
jgi:hypothetical protein